METLHLELKLDIFSRLPVESIFVCKLVCKPWLRLLKNDPCFAQMHLRRRLLTLQQQLLHDVQNEEDDFSQSQTSGGGFELGFIYLKCLEGNERSSQLWYGNYSKNDDNEHSFKKDKRINHPNIMTRNNRWKRWNDIIGSCNGLICCCIPHNEIEDPIYILNPITREFVNLPRFNIRDKIYSNNNHSMAGGFGYSSSTNEYKVVRIFYPNGGYLDPQLGQVQVYTLGDGNGWRDKGEITYSFRYRRGTLVNGELHWLLNNDKLKMVAFNLALEEFHFVASPPVDGGCRRRQLCDGKVVVSFRLCIH